MSYVHLHNHTHFSLLDGANDINKMIARAAELNMSALAITDHGNMFGVLDFYKAAKKAGIKPIIGMEAYIAPGARTEKSGGGKGGSRAAYHLVLLAKNEAGYRNLMKLSSAAYTEGFYYKPRIDREILAQHSEGLIVLSACMKGEVFSALHRDDVTGAQKTVEWYQEHFGKDYYLEIQNHRIPLEAGYEKVYRLAKDMGVPVVATNDVHYLNKGDHSSHDILLCLQSGKAYDDPNRMRYNTEDLYLKSVDEMYEVFPEHSDALERTLEVAEKINLELEFGKLLLPKFPIPPEFHTDSLDDYLKKIAFDGAKKIFGELSEEITNRLEYELSVIRKTGFAGYFLIVQDFINYARQQNIPVGLGRGSAAGSLVAYSLGITRVDPLRYDLLFERFLNPERVTMPDIDIDFCFERREEVIDYVRQKYGERNVAQIITFGTMASKGVIRDVARVLGVDYSDADRISKLIPVFQGKPMPLARAFEEIPELREIAQSGNPVYQELIRHAKVLEGLARHASVHAAGIIIAPDDITNYVPLYMTEDQKKQKVITTQFTMLGCEEIGLLKMDFLGLRTLTVLHKAAEMIREKGVEIDLDKIPLDDKETYEVFSEGNTAGIFQFESNGMREFLRKLKPNRIEDLIAMNALYRPGPMENIDTFINRKFGRERIEYLHPKLEPILKETYGIIVYQEQVMRIASDLGGFSLGKADILRRAMGKKKKEVMEKLREEFLEGAKNNGISEKTAVKIYDLIFKFASYGFNKSHSAAYAILAYQTAYLKRHYPAEFMAASLTSEIDDPSRIIILIDECRRMGLEVLAPDINRSDAQFRVTEKNEISFGMAAIKNVGKAAIGRIIEARKEHGPFKSIFHFMQHVDLRAVNKKVLESLIQAGAMDSLEGNRAQKFAAIEMAVQFAQKYQEKEQNKAQISLFETLNNGQDDAGEGLIQYPALPDLDEWPLQERLLREKELLGFYISGHPLDRYKMEIDLFSNLDWQNPDSFKENTEIQTAAVITTVRNHMDKKGRFMAFITLEDRFNSFEGVVFASVFEKYGEYVKAGKMVFVKGRVSDQNESSFKVLCNEIIPIEEVRNRFAGQLKLAIHTHETGEKQVQELYELVKENPGTVPLVFEVHTNGNGEGLTMRSKKYRVLLTDGFIQKLYSILGKNAVKIGN